MPDTELLPVDVSDDEKLARAVFHPYHVKNSTLKSAAFKAPPGRKDVSVNRLLILSADDCKQKAKILEEQPKKVYRGFAVVAAGRVRELGSEVVDSRTPPNYVGHADIVHQIALERNQPAPPEFNYLLTRMARSAAYFPDPDPCAPYWSGDDLTSGSDF